MFVLSFLCGLPREDGAHLLEQTIFSGGVAAARPFLPCVTTGRISGGVFLEKSRGFSGGIGESGLGRWMGWMGVPCPVAGKLDCPGAGIAAPVAGKWTFSSRRRACSEASCCQA